MTEEFGHYEELELELAPETELVAIQPLADRLRANFSFVRIRKQSVGVAAGGLEIALLVVVTVPLLAFWRAFMSEAGRDAYRLLMDALVSTYKRLPIHTGRGRLRPLGFRVHLDDPPRDRPRTVTFTLPEQLTADQIGKAIQLMLPEIERRGVWERLVYDPESERWERELDPTPGSKRGSAGAGGNAERYR